MTPDPSLHWFRVAIGSDGVVSSCRQVERYPDADVAGVFYVVAPDPDSAEKAALARYRERQRQALRDRRQRHQAAGKCRCGSSRPEGELYCDTCRRKSREDHARQAARLRGEPVAAPPPKSVSFHETQERRAMERRLETLLEVREAWRARTPERFGKWLEARILELGGRK